MIKRNTNGKFEDLTKLFKNDLNGNKSFYNKAIGYLIKNNLARDEDAARDGMQEFYLKMTGMGNERYAESYLYNLDTSKEILEDKKLTSWLFTSIRNKFIDLRRKRKSRGDERQLDFEKGDLMDILLNNQIRIIGYEFPKTPEEIAIENEEKENSKGIVDRNILFLSPKLEKIMRLRFFHGLKYREIAEQEGIPIGTAKSRLYCAKKEFEKLVRGTGYNIEEIFYKSVA